jgi:murein DD-endopeptidase MepM/ murein hydrolase activator NlpD
MRKSGIVAGVVGASLLTGAILMTIAGTEDHETVEAKASVSDGLVSTAHANTSTTEGKEPLDPEMASASKSVGAPSGAPTPTPSSAATSDEHVAPASTEMTPRRPEPLTKTVSVTRGDTLMELLVRGDVPRAQAHAVVTALKPVYDLRRMSIGQSFTLLLSPAPEAGSGSEAGENASRDLKSLSFRPSVEQDIIVTREGAADFKAKVIDRPLERLDAHAEGRITSSLYDSAIAAELPIDVLMRLIQVFSFDVDFQREVQPGDGFEVLYDEFRDELGAPARTGEIVWASMTLSGKKLQYARFKPKSGFADYYDRRGQSVKKTLMRTPINGARLSSRFGKRRHPVLGYTKVHRGVDFAAPKGVPIMAAGDGVIESIGRNGSFGKYIRIRHDSTYKTAYAHMSGYGRGLKKGTRVRQGSVIGYVGTTGRSTGPHLHYEVLKNGRQINPMSVRLPAGDKLKGKALKTFLAGWPAIDKRVAQAKGGRTVASD